LQRRDLFYGLRGMKVRIRERSWLARLAAFRLGSKQVAIVFGNTIHLHGTSRSEFLQQTSWVCHELQHVQQYHRMGRIRFVALYLLESIRNGYQNNYFEREARARETDLTLLNGVDFV